MSLNKSKGTCIACGAVMIILVLYHHHYTTRDYQGYGSVQKLTARQPTPLLLDANVVHILTTLDEHMLVGLPMLINSVLNNTKSPVQFHIIWCADNPEIVKQYLSCFDINKLNLSLLHVAEDVKQFMAPVFWDYLRLTQTAHKALGNCANILRLQAHRIFPRLDKVLWLDIDMIVQGDVSELWNLALSDEWIKSANRQTYSGATYGKFLGLSKLSRETLVLYKKRSGKNLNTSANAFNNAVSLLNLKKWRAEDQYLQDSYNFWMTTAMKLKNLPGMKWWFMSSQSMMWFTYQENVTIIPIPGWHCDGLGWSMRDKVTYEMAEKANLLHWNGDEKPWMDSSQVHYPLWSRHKPTQCEGKAVCTRTNSKNAMTFYQCAPK